MFNAAASIRSSGVSRIPQTNENVLENDATLLRRYALADDQCVEFLLRKDGDLSAVLKYSDDSSVALDIRCSPGHLHAIRTGDHELAARYFSGAYIVVVKNDHGLPIAVSIYQRGEGGGGKLADLSPEQQQGLKRELDQIETELHRVSNLIAQRKNNVPDRLRSLEDRLDQMEEHIPGEPLFFQAVANFHRCYADYLSTFDLEDKGVQHRCIAECFENKLANAQSTEAWRIPSMAPPLPSASSPALEDDDLLSNFWLSDEDIYQTVAEHTVFIRKTNGGEGAGCLFQDHDGQTKLLTAAHVMNAGNQHDADQAYCADRSLMIGAGSDITSHDASIRTVVDRSFVSMHGLPLGDPSRVRRGDTVYLCGMPFQSTSPHVHEGKISLIEREPSGRFHMKIDGTAVPGMSGGPIVAIQDGQAVLIGMIASESFDPIRGFVDAQNRLHLQLADQAVRNHHAEEYQEDWAAMIRSTPTFTQIRQGQLHDADLAGKGYTKDHFNAIWEELFQSGILTADGEVIGSSVSESAVESAVYRIALPPNPTQATARFLERIRNEQEQLKEGAHIPELGYVTPSYTKALITALRDAEILDAGGHVGEFTEDGISTALKRVVTLLFLKHLESQHRHATMTAGQAPRPEGADDPLDSYANVGLTLANSLSTNIVKGYFVADILAAENPSSSLNSMMDVDGGNDDFPITRFASGFKTDDRPKPPKTVGKFELPTNMAPVRINGQEFPCDRHHIIPQTHMQLLYDIGYATNKRIFQDLLGVPHDVEVEKDEWVWAPFNLFLGPNGSACRSDNPKENEPETRRPASFPKTKWGHVHQAAQWLREYHGRYAKISEETFAREAQSTLFQQEQPQQIEAEKDVVRKSLHELNRLAKSAQSLPYHEFHATDWVLDWRIDEDKYRAKLKQ